MATPALRLSLRLSSWIPGRILIPIHRRRESGTGNEQQDARDALARPPFRSRKYQPPAQLEERVRAVLERVTGSPAAPDWQETQLGEGERFHLLCELSDELRHTVPNSRLHQMRSPGDILHFYQQPADTDSFAFQELAGSELPPNLRVNWIYEGRGGGGGDGLNPG
ncbi:39S ribosomal protein L50, mitochondrial-like [Carcharodon carcharias]|uniref:39S ribosomal protein L50, mitochondrial-like n=1 Tax=Carcharodon carcharias TaxID=13397 RepID=UPI001B7F20A0|nr:39S ribosomal protein L50, mitochondrial-like [Carcharodon carcharias]